MDGLQRNPPIAVFIRRIIVVMGLLALVSPSFGPLVDHHFAERHYDHTHVYLGQHQTDHVHLYDSPHRHHPSDALVTVPSPDEILFMTSTDAAAPVLAALGAAPNDADLTFPVYGDTASLQVFFETYAPHTESFVLPPRKPPRA